MKKKIANRISRFRHVITGVLFALVFATAFTAVPPEALAACYSGAKARGIISSNGLVSMGQVVSGFRRNGAQVSSARLCSSGSGYVYRLTVVTRNGRIKRVNVNAQTGY